MSAASERGELIAEFGDILHLWNVGDATKRDRISSALADCINALGYTRQSRAETPNADFWMDLWWKVSGDDWPVPEDLPAKFAEAVIAAGFGSQSRAEIQAEAVESAVARVESLYKGSVRDLEERAQNPRASKVHKARGFGRMDALATALSDLRDYAQRIREGGEP